MHNSATNAGPALVQGGSPNIQPVANPLAKLKINNNEMWEAILTGKYTDGLGPKKEIDIKMIYHGGAGSVLNQRSGATKGIEAHRKVEFVVSQNYVLNSDSRYADIVLPATTQWERFGGLLDGNREILIYHSQICEPLHEAKDDSWIAEELGKKLGIDPTMISPLSLKQQVFNQLADAEVMKADGSDYEPLVTFTSEDIRKLGVMGNPQQGRITYQEFKEKGIYQVPRKPGDVYEYTTFEDFIADPVANKLKTPTGKLQIHSQSLSDKIKSFGWTEKAPIAKYEPSVEGYEEGLKNGYPYQLVTIHYFRRSHSTLDNVPFLREAFPQNLIINTADADKYKIKEGDIVKISSMYGAVIRPAHLTETIVPGVIAIGEGAWIEMDEEENVDKAGCTNILTGGIGTGQGHSGYNSVNVKIEKYNKPLDPDVKWPQRVVL
jgi:anaerobic dimethyl sulfoxide reductase subunit A